MANLNTTNNTTTQWVRQDLSKVRAAAQRGDAAACFEMAQRCMFGRGVAVDPREAFDWCTRAAERGYVQAQNMLGFCYATGLGVRSSNRAAFDAFVKAALMGNAVALYNLAVCYREGIGVTRDAALSEQLMQRSAKAGYRKAMGVCAVRLYNRAASQEERDIAISWFEKAAAQGDELASQNLRKCRKGGKPQEFAASAREFDPRDRFEAA